MDSEYDQVTGDERVDEAVAGLTGLADLPVDEHPAALAETHRRLSEILGDQGEGEAGGQSPA